MEPWRCRSKMSHVGISETRVSSVVEAILEKSRVQYALPQINSQNEAGQENLVFLQLWQFTGME